jgi:S-adenosylmethionine-diacylglycerol 3-amino-3-carboxypropyl transferase
MRRGLGDFARGWVPRAQAVRTILAVCWRGFSTMQRADVMARSMINAAVHRQDTDRKQALLDRLFAVWFARFVYNQIWEDPAVDLEALALTPTSRIVTIASGGCNVLNYLSADPARIVAVDLNPAHTALTRLKLAAMQHLPDQEAFFRFFAVAKDPANVAFYDSHLRWTLDKATRKFWDHRTLLGSRRIEFFAKGLYRQALLGKFIGFLHGFARLHGQRPSLLLSATSLAEQRAIFDAEIEPLFRIRLVRALCRQPMLLYSLGIPPSQFANLQEASGGDLAGLYFERIRRLACDFALSENYFAWQAFGRKYDTRSGTALPPYLQRANYAAIRERLPRVETHTISMTDWLESQPAQCWDRYVLLDSLDWMDAATLSRLWQQIRRTSRTGARVIFRTAGLRSPLEQLLAPAELAGWRCHAEDAKRLFERDRSAIYGGFHLYSRD